MGTDAESAKQSKLLKIRGNAWYIQCDRIRTFFTALGEKKKLIQLKIILEGIST
jgi:hypothetical protein